MDSVELQFEGKREYVQGVFDSIAPYYDSMNLFLSWGLLRTWQRVLLSETRLPETPKILDVCTGTGELALLLAEKAGPAGEVIGLDMSESMLEVARTKACGCGERGKTRADISFIVGDALQLPFAAESFDCVTMGFALRNVTDISRAVSEMRRVCNKNGQVICLEISEPDNVLWRAGFCVYFYRLIPLLGRFIDTGYSTSGKTPAYTWLAQSLKGFPQGEEMRRIFEEAGLTDVCCKPLNGGIVTVYRGVRKKSQGCMRP
jgi:demethylmenaquinone methyltransferase/2-methoxy-6-polyprenyl-1,4-benzoquinol methylase